MWTAIGALAGLVHRAATGRGTIVDASLFETGLAWMKGHYVSYLSSGQMPERHRTGSNRVVPFEAFESATGPMIIAAGNDRLFGRTCEVLGHAEWADDPRFATNEERVRNRDVLVPMLDEAFASRPADEWLTALGSAAVPCAPIRTMDEVFAAPEGASTVDPVPDPGRATTLQLVRNPIRLDGQALPTRLPPPLLGEHTDEILGGR
jgi:crotonobetainyl-CoA:carnitine CoA-transferase CaiB-like acyl-CoA transferase